MIFPHKKNNEKKTMKKTLIMHLTVNKYGPLSWQVYKYSIVQYICTMTLYKCFVFAGLSAGVLHMWNVTVLILSTS